MLQNSFGIQTTWPMNTNYKSHVLTPGWSCSFLHTTDSAASKLLLHNGDHGYDVITHVYKNVRQRVGQPTMKTGKHAPSWFQHLLHKINTFEPVSKQFPWYTQQRCWKWITADLAGYNKHTQCISGRKQVPTCLSVCVVIMSMAPLGWIGTAVSQKS